MRRSPSRPIFILLTFVFLAALSGPAAAEGLSFRGVGPRVGVAIDPDQFVAGVQFDLGDIVKQLRLQPNLDLGIGSDTTFFSAYAGVYWFFGDDGNWDPYAGGDLGLSYQDVDNEGSDIDVAFNVVGGVETRLRNNNRFLIELKIGVVEDPDFKVLVGWTF